MDSEKIRAFIAVDFPSEIVREVARVQDVLRNRKFTGKLTKLENLHLTLKFFGGVEADVLERVREELRKIKTKKFEAYLAGAGIFSYRGMPRIVWSKVGGNGIFNLQKQVDEAMERCGFEKENRFMSHLTLARVNYANDAEEFKEYVSNLGVKKIKFWIDNFKLMKSELRTIGSKYDVLEDYGLE